MKKADKFLIFSLSLAVFGLAFGNVFMVANTCGTSMLPTSKDGAIILCQKAFIDRENLENGTIIAYQHVDGKRIFHRIIYVGDGFYVCKGDNNLKEDYPVVYPKDIIGVYLIELWSP